MPGTCPHCAYEASRWEANQPVCIICGRLKYTLFGCIWKIIVIAFIIWILGMIFNQGDSQIII